MKLSIVTTVLRPDSDLASTLSSVRGLADCEHIITVARDFHRLGEFVAAGDHHHATTFLDGRGAGISDGFNLAIEKATGDFVWVLNSGDRQVQVSPLAQALASQTDLDFVYGDVRLRNGTVLRARPRVTYHSALIHGMGFCHGAWVVRRRFHQEHGWYSSAFRIGMDYDLLLRALQHGARGRYVDGVVADIAPGGVSTHLIARTREYARIVASHKGWLTASVLAGKWIAASLARRASMAMRHPVIRSQAHAEATAGIGADRA